MKRIFQFLPVFFIFSLVFSFTMMALAQVPSPTPDPSVIPPVSTDDFLGFLLQSLGGFKGASALAIAGLGVQIFMKFLGTDLAGSLLSKIPGSAKILIVTGLTLVSGVLGLMTTGGLSFGAALLHSSTLAAVMVFANQVYKQLFVKTS